MRAQVGALSMSVITLVGLGLGPSVVGVLTSAVYGKDSAVRDSLLWVTLVGLAGAVALLAAGLAPYRRSVAYRAAWTDPVSAS
jgi:hypothetical protein